MTPRERVVRTINLEKPDRIPKDIGSTNCTTIALKAYDDLKKELNVTAENEFIMRNFQIVHVHEEVLQTLNIDTRGIIGKPTKNEVKEKIDERTYISDWGITYHMPEGGLYYDMIENPLKGAGLEELKNFEWPVADDPARVDGLKQYTAMRKKENRYALIGDMVETGIFEPCWYLRGFEDFLMDLIINKEFAHALMESMVTLQIERYEYFLDEVGEFLDIVFVGDDLATSETTIISPELYREMVKPYQKRYFDALKSMTDAKLMYHSCGNIIDFIDDLIELGVDILNPVQVNAKGMDSKELKKKFGDRLCFWGGIDTSRVLPQGREEDVEEEVKQRIEDFGPEGYVLCAVHDIQPDVPGKNTIAMFRAGDKYGGITL